MRKKRLAVPRGRAWSYATKKKLPQTPPLFCQHCGKPGKLQRHHPDYSKPLEIEWLCKPCHTYADDLRRLYEDNNLPIVSSPDGSPVIPLDRLADEKLLRSMWVI